MAEARLRLEPFNPVDTSYSWATYKIELTNSLLRDGVEDAAARKRALVEVLPLNLPEWLNDSFHPAQVTDAEVTFERIIAAFDDRFRPRESKRFAAVQFHNRGFRRGQEFVEWFQDLHRWAALCGFGTFGQRDH